jgi:hypothetical protein
MQLSAALLVTSIVASCGPRSPGAAPAPSGSLQRLPPRASSAAPSAAPSSAHSGPAECEVEAGTAARPTDLTQQQVLGAIFRGYQPTESEIRQIDGRVVGCDGKVLSQETHYPSLHVDESGRAALADDLVVAASFFGHCVVAVVGVADRRVVVRDAMSVGCLSSAQRVQTGQLGLSWLIVLEGQPHSPASWKDFIGSGSRAEARALTFSGGVLSDAGLVTTSLVVVEPRVAGYDVPLDESLRMTSKIILGDRGLIVEEYWSEGRPGRKRGEARVTRTYAYRDGELRPEDTSTPFKLR